VIDFKRTVFKTSFHDPTRNFEVNEVSGEKRCDPLTGMLVRLFSFRKMTFPRHDWTPFVEESRQRFCPFCPGVLEKATPRFTEDFIPGGKLQVGGAVVIPNLNPYETHSAVVVMSPEHYLSMQDLTPAVIRDSLEVGLEYLRAVAEKDPENARYSSINWNYMPYAGGSLIHPHLQVVSGAEPCNLDRSMLEAAARYDRENHRSYWEDLIGAERGGERDLGSSGKVHWLASFAPLALGDVTAVIPGCATIRDVGGELLGELAAGFKKVISYYDSINAPAFNMALYFAGPEDRGFRCTARLVARYTLFPLVGSDVSNMQMLHHDPWSLFTPEYLAADLRPFFQGI